MTPLTMTTLTQKRTCPLPPQVRAYCVCMSLLGDSSLQRYCESGSVRPLPAMRQKADTSGSRGVLDVASQFFSRCRMPAGAAGSVHVQGVPFHLCEMP